MSEVARTKFLSVALKLCSVLLVFSFEYPGMSARDSPHSTCTTDLDIAYR